MSITVKTLVDSFGMILFLLSKPLIKETGNKVKEIKEIIEKKDGENAEV